MPGIHSESDCKHQPPADTDTGEGVTEAGAGTEAKEAAQLELSLYAQFEEDIARIFDESIHSDLELVSGRSNILTHSCILKTRTRRFYQQLEALPTRNIIHEAYDEIYSFISEVYTECCLDSQEQQIITYLSDYSENLKKASVKPVFRDTSLKGRAGAVGSPDERSISSDYVSLPSGCSFSSVHEAQLNVERAHKMAHMFASSDSGLENTESVTLLQDVVTKEEKQRQNEEIVTLESSSLSSETGSWESVFPPRRPAPAPARPQQGGGGAETTNTSVLSERRPKGKTPFPNNLTLQLERSPFKSTSCFIDAATLVDDEDVVHNGGQNVSQVRSEPVPCAVNTAKCDISPDCHRDRDCDRDGDCDWSDSHDDSLELLDHKDPDSLKHDQSPIFDMTPLTEDSLCANVFEAAATTTNENVIPNGDKKDRLTLLSKNALTSTPNNSILSLGPCRVNDSEDGDSDSTLVSQEGSGGHRNFKKRLDLYPSSAALTHPLNDERQSKSATAAWVVDMSAKSEPEKTSFECRKPLDRNHELVRRELRSSSRESHRSRGSVDSDGSERSAHKFYIDLSSLPDPSPPKEELTKPANIFSMYIDLGDKSAVKEMPARLSSSLNAKRTASPRASPKPSPKLKNSVTKKNVKENHDKDISETTPLKSAAKSNSRNSQNSTVSNNATVGSSNKTGGSSNRTGGASNRTGGASKKTDGSSNKTGGASKKTDGSNTTTARSNNPTVGSNNTTNGSNNTTNGSNNTTNGSNNNTNNTVISNNPVSGAKATVQQNLSYFEVYEALCEDTDISVSEILNMPKPDESRNLTAVAEEPGNEVFVRLSDLDKPRPIDVRMTRSIPDDGPTPRDRSDDVISSFHSENALSLNRLFPNLRKDLSASMPGSLSRPTTTYPYHTYPTSDASEWSSGHSSFTRSGVGDSLGTSTQEEQHRLAGSSQSRLGEDLLRMFREEIAPDVVVQVTGGQFKAHKCILASRCQYFAAILSGDWVKNAGDVIHLPFSAEVVHLTLCHIYSGSSRIPEHVSVVELATLADMLGLEGLKEALVFTLAHKYCHNFHKPCHVCICGALECFCLSSAYGLDELYHRCLRWISEHYVRIWPTRTFASLPRELQERCSQRHVARLAPATVLETVCGFGSILAALPCARWSEAVERASRDVITSASRYISHHLASVLKSSPPAPPASGNPAAARAMEKCMMDAIERTAPDEAYRSYAYLSSVISDGTSSGTLLDTYAKRWRGLIENRIVRFAPRALASDLRLKLRGLPATPPIQQQDKRSSPAKKQISDRDVEIVRANFVPYSRKPRKVPPPLIPSAPPRARDRARKPEERMRQRLEEKPNRIEVKVRQKTERRPAPVPAPRSSRPRVKHETNLTSNLKPANKGSVTSQDSLATSSRSLTANTDVDVDVEVDSLADPDDRFATFTKVKHGDAASSTSLQRPTTLEPTNKPKTKIPVYQKRVVTKAPPPRERPISARSSGALSGAGSKTIEGTKGAGASTTRHCSGSLMMATKSSLAKVVPKNMTAPVTAAVTVANNRPKKRSDTVKTMETVKNKSAPPGKGQSPPLPKPIPAMDRSGTFLKDEPTFGDKTTFIDVSQ